MNPWIVRGGVVALVLVVGLMLWRPWVPASAPGQAAAPALTVGGCAMNAQLSKMYAAHDWYQIARMPTGAFVQFAPKAMVCDRAGGLVDVPIQLIHRDPQHAAFEDAQSIERLEFLRERYLYRLNCKDRTFAFVRREIMGEGETVVKTVEMLRGDASDWRPFTRYGPVAQLEGPACRVALAGA